MGQTDNLRSFSHAEASSVLGSRPPFVIDGILRDSLNLVFGESEHGKSTIATAMVAAMVNGESHFLGRAIQQQRWCAGIVTGDSGETADYKERFDALLAPGRGERVYYFEPLYLPPKAEMWHEVLIEAHKHAINVLVVDNLTTFVPGSLNDDNAVTPLLNALHSFTGRKITIIALAHVSEKRGVHGGKSHKPLGSSVITARSRWHCEVQKRSDDFTLSLSGNGGAPSEIRAHMNDWDRYELVKTADLDAGALRERAAKRNGQQSDRERSGPRKSKGDQIREYVLAECRTLPNKDTAEKIVTKFGGKVATHKSNLSRGAYGIKLQDGAWMDSRQAA